MKTVKVVAALIKQDSKYLIGLRSTGKFVDFWEFPGGKVEPNEDHISALKREIKEEFNVEIKDYGYIDADNYFEELWKD